jgi:hypothetical protein
MMMTSNGVAVLRSFSQADGEGDCETEVGAKDAPRSVERGSDVLRES